ncbi:MAG: hypothetical protein ITG04_00820 [Proteiniphilum sp.]|nr:hypothetical protein [Proteiniphilum sp.]
MKKINFIIIAILCMMHSYGKQNSDLSMRDEMTAVNGTPLMQSNPDYNYLRILRSFPSIPDNTLTASPIEIERYKEKLEIINELLYDCERAEKEKQRIRDNMPVPFDLEKLNKFDAAQKEWEKIYDQYGAITMPLSETEMDILHQMQEGTDSLMKLNEPLNYELEDLRSKPAVAGHQQRKKQLEQQIYHNRLKFYKELDERNRKNLQKMLQEYEKLAPIVDKLDNYIVDGYRISSGSVGLTALRDLYQSMLRAYSYNAEAEGEMDPFDAVQRMNRMILNKTP